MNQELAVAGIYALSDPTAGRVMYIGQAKNILRRYKQHCSLSNNLSERRLVTQWCAGLITQGIKPGLLVLEETDDLDSREKYWINQYAKNDLLNMTEGGQGGWSHLPATSMPMPWHPYQAPLQRALINLRRLSSQLGNKRLAARADELQQRNAALRKNTEDWIVANLALVVRNSRRKTWPGLILVGDSYYG